MRFSGSSWVERSQDHRSDSGYPVGVNEKTTTTKATLNGSRATVGTRIPPRRRAVKNDNTIATTATMGAPYSMSVKPNSPKQQPHPRA